MTGEFRSTRRWAHWSFGVLAAALLLGMGWVLFSGIRLLIPVYLLGSFWLLAIAVNRKTIVFNPDGLTIAVEPIPVSARLHFERGQIRCIYVRYAANVDSNGVERQPFYMVGVETMTGFQTPLLGPFPELQPAREAVQRIAFAVNTGPHEYLIPVRARNEAPPVPAVKKLPLLLWTVAFLIALLAGVRWQAVSLINR